MRRFVFIGRLVGLLLCAASLAGCQTLGGTGLITSSVTAELAPEAVAAIADDMIGRLAEQVGPGSTTIQLRTDGSMFGQALEASLRARGYAVAIDQTVEGADVVPLAYSIDSFDGSVLARLSTSKRDLTRMYQLSPTGATPISPLSIMQRAPADPS